MKIEYTDEDRPIVPRGLKYIIVYGFVHNEFVMLRKDYWLKYQRASPTFSYPPIYWHNFPHHARTAFEDWCKIAGY